MAAWSCRVRGARTAPPADGASWLIGMRRWSQITSAIPAPPSKAKASPVMVTAGNGRDDQIQIVGVQAVCAPIRSSPLSTDTVVPRVVISMTHTAPLYDNDALGYRDVVLS